MTPDTFTPAETRISWHSFEMWKLKQNPCTMEEVKTYEQGRQDACSELEAAIKRRINSLESLIGQPQNIAQSSSPEQVRSAIQTYKAALGLVEGAKTKSRDSKRTAANSPDIVAMPMRFVPNGDDYVTPDPRF